LLHTLNFMAIRPLQILFVLFMLHPNYSNGSENWILEPTGNYEIPLDFPQLGGLSAINVHQSGKRFVTISDRGKYFIGNIERDNAETIIDIQIIESGSLLNSAGEHLSGRNTDSESLTTIDNQAFFISFESNHRIMFHESLQAAGTFLPKHADFKKFSPNKGLEAIAVNSKGQIFAIPEEPPGEDVDFPLYKFNGETWSIFSRFPTSGSFLVTDSVFLPDGDILILERDYDWSVGFKMQLRLLHLNDYTITGQTALLSLNSGLHNHEGLSLWQNESKQFFITSISDNNFLPFVTSEIKEFKLQKTNINK